MYIRFRLIPPALCHLYWTILDYLEELGLDFRSDRVGKTWLAVEADAVAQWCAQDSAPEEVRSGSRL